MLPLTPKVIARILGHLNRYRDIIASGNAENENTKAKFPKASRMRELIWDWELCYLAEIHVKFLAVAYDNCRNTLRHPRSGQTIVSRVILDKRSYGLLFLFIRGMQCTRCGHLLVVFSKNCSVSLFK